MALPVPIEPLETASFVLLLVAIVASVYVLRGKEIERRLLDPVRRRFVLGVPWGTLVLVCFLYAVYYLLQSGGQTGGPVVVGYRSWSVTYPVGMLTAAFTHASDGHLVGNALGTVVFAPIAEYAWSHYPTRRGSHTFSDWPSNPFVRILLFVVAVLVVGLVTSFFTPGPLIGFSGVVFAFAGVAIVTRPTTTVFALAAEGVVRLTYRAIDSPVAFASGSQRYVTPGWADVAIQGHALGIFVGMLVGYALVRSRDAWPGYRRVWFATLAFAVGKSLHTLYWYLSGSEYVLFRGLGTAAVLVLAGVTALALARGDRLLVDRIDLSRREAAIGVILSLTLAISLAAVPFNLVSVDPGTEADQGVEVRDYTVTYAENVPNQYNAGVPIPVLGDALDVNMSGVIVYSERRNAWERVVPAGQLASRGWARVPVGGPGWRETIVVRRTGWSFVEGNSTYKVFVTRPDVETKQVFAAEPIVSPVVLNGSRVAIAPADQGYDLLVARNETVVDRGKVPGPGENTTVGNISFNRTANSLEASTGQTRVPLAKRAN